MSSSSQVMYTLYDLKADFYSAPFFAPNDQVAIRDFHKLVYVSNAIAPAYASDFILYEVGSFNSDTGLFDSLPSIALVIEGSALKPDVS